jgi:hypothetical protein
MYDHKPDPHPRNVELTHQKPQVSSLFAAHSLSSYPLQMKQRRHLECNVTSSISVLRDFIHVIYHMNFYTQSNDLL